MASARRASGITIPRCNPASRSTVASFPIGLPVLQEGSCICRPSVNVRSTDVRLLLEGPGEILPGSDDADGGTDEESECF